MVGDMKKILVVCDNLTIERGAKLIFEKRKEHLWHYTHSEGMTNKLAIHIFDLIISLHCKTVFPKELVQQVRCINIHPGLRRGMFTHVYDIYHGSDYSGCIIHTMDEGIDTGPILFRHGIEVRPTDTSESLYNRIVDAELALLELHLDEIIDGTALSTPQLPGRKNHTLQDFKRLCDIDPERVGTFREFYNLLRALSHGDYKNAHIGDTYITLKIHENGNP
jgi:methionyl-tRNA formyltransferase